MKRENDFEVRSGRIGDRGARGRKTFVGEALAAAERAGGMARPRSPSRGRFGRGRAASLNAVHARQLAARGAVVKARVVRTSRRKGGLPLHLKYLQREGVTRGGEGGVVFDAELDKADPAAFAERCAEDRHHFRFIVSPDDAEQLGDLRAYARDLMRQVAQDLGTRLDWVAIDHWNTGHPHLHVLLRGRADDGADLVISPDYIGHGLRARAGELVQLELGPRTELEIGRRLARQVDAERWTELDRGLRRLGGDDGVVDLRPVRGRQAGELDQAQISRMRRLEARGLASPVGTGRWRLSTDAEPVLRAMARQGDVIARLHAAMGSRAGDPADFALDTAEVIGRLAGRGHDDELRGSAFAVIEGLDGKVHHVTLRDLDDASDASLGAIVELRTRAGGRKVLAVRSDLDLAGQVEAQGATWLDRRLLGGTLEEVAPRGFGQEVRDALAARGARLEGEGLARRRGAGWVFAQDLLGRLRARELAGAAEELSGRTGLSWSRSGPGHPVEGVYRRRIDLASGRFAMIEGALGFELVPWRSDLDGRLGREVSGVMGENGRVNWSTARRPTLQI